MTNQVEVSIKVNGMDSKATIEPRMLLVHYLREELNLTGTHIGCDTSQCGACTVLLDGDPVKSCTVLAIQANGKSITTVEGLANREELHPIQQSFWEKHGLQCGFCTPGVMMAAIGLLDENPTPTDNDIRDALEGVICRCTGYQFIVDAVKHAAQIMASEEKVAMADSLKVEGVR